MILTSSKNNKSTFPHKKPHSLYLALKIYMFKKLFRSQSGKVVPQNATGKILKIVQCNGLPLIISSQVMLKLSASSQFSKKRS